ncbi:hypothetical protein [Kushneria phyllosphaerae]|uniref:D-apionate lactonase N-terminal domain-containing protein n=1 Tax=Kushneria phyllosphaerae TaxID=2100822 RepID=A0A2R8CHR5_9GAMM|nr:hypothetical protein [Kushneria phyllosphaerae]SPJ32352.1 hypothetical protein KSP9073_00352 [Kushneria phyllosphaerae]
MDDSGRRERHYGTALVEPQVTHHEVGALSLGHQAGALRALCCRNIECVRGIRPVIRDDQWGTHHLTTLTERVTSDPASLQLVHEFETAGRALSGRFEAHVSACGVEVALTLTVARTLTTCRSGLIVLLPLAGVVGYPVQITHGDGTQKASRFPELVSPGQPFFDIKELNYTVQHGPTVRLSFEGEVFEMEDQRNWSDASFKIYSRPLAWPTPYTIEVGQTVVQEVSIKIQEKNHDVH